MADPSTSWSRVKPEGLAEAILVVTVFFTVVCAVVFGLRIFIRLKTRLFGLEDYLMALGVALNMVHNGTAIYGSYVGVGTRDSKLTVGNLMEAAKAILFWQLFYVTGSIFIKSSICATLIRIAVQRKYIYILYGLIAATAVSNLVAFSAAVARCKPIEAAWDPSKGKCLNQSIIITLTYVVSAVNIFTDWSVAVLPIFILWKIQMRRKLKYLTAGILGIGALASAATIIRMPYSSAYSAKVNQVHDIGNIILWTVVECSLGILAGCLPMLRALFKSLAKDYSSNEGYRPYEHSSSHRMGTISRSKGAGGINKDPYGGENGATVVADNDSNQDMDSESTRNIITVTREFLTSSDSGGKEVVRGVGRPDAYVFGKSRSHNAKRYE